MDTVEGGDGSDAGIYTWTLTWCQAHLKWVPRTLLPPRPFLYLIHTQVQPPVNLGPLADYSPVN